MLAWPLPVAGEERACSARSLDTAWFCAGWESGILFPSLACERAAFT